MQDRLNEDIWDLLRQKIEQFEFIDKQVQQAMGQDMHLVKTV